MHRTQAIMSEIEDIKNTIRELYPESPVKDKADKLAVEFDSDVDWEDVFAKYVDSIKTLATQDVVNN